MTVFAAGVTVCGLGETPAMLADPQEHSGKTFSRPPGQPAAIREPAKLAGPAIAPKAVRVRTARNASNAFI
ncbi:MAG: hypothetical protein ACP5H2_04300 [Solirubrobacteraceae bacterium]